MAINSFSVGGDPSVPANQSASLGLFEFPAIWHNLAYLFSWFQLFLGILLISVVCNEFSQKTLRQNIIDGMSKWEVIAAKELVILLLSIFSSFLLIVIALIFGENPNEVNIWEGFKAVPAYFVSILLYLNFAYLVSFLVKKSGFAIGLLLIYSLIIENLITWKLPDSIGKYFPMELGSTMIPNPWGGMLGMDATIHLTSATVVASIVYVALFIGAIYWMLKRGHAAK
jgi:ABC-type transport system involved in multi-copper enzyme maturation permease subunit